jgi:hypothetical protein
MGRLAMEILKKIERIDKEDFDQFSEWYIVFKTGSTTREAIFENLLFKPPKGINAYNWDPSITIKSLLPLYTTIYQRIHPSQCRSVNDFKKVYGFSPEAIAILSEKKRIIPVFGKISEYPVEIIEPIIESEVYLTHGQSLSLEYTMMHEMGVFSEPLAKDLLYPISEELKGFIETASHIKPVKSILETMILDFMEIPEFAQCMPQDAKDILLLSVSINARAMLEASSLNSVLQHPNSFPTNITSSDVFRSLKAKGIELRPVDKSCDLEYIVRKLGIAYSEGIDLDDYLEIFDHRTTKNMRRIVNEIILEHDKRKEKGVKLNRIIDEYNEKLTEICNSKGLKFIYSFSNLISQNLESISAVIFGIGFLSLTGSPFGFLAPIAQKLSGFEIPKEEREGIKIFLKENLSKLFFSPDILQLHEIKGKI